MERYRALLDRKIRCTCGSRAVIDAGKHAEDCLRRCWREATDEIDALTATNRGAVEAERLLADALEDDHLDPLDVGRAAVRALAALREAS